VVFSFAGFVLDTERRELRRGGEVVPMEPQVFDLLVTLVRNRERVLTKDDLIAAIWQGRIVSDSAITTRINAVRRAVDDNGAVQRLIRTVPRRGVRFVGEVLEDRASAVGEPSSAALGIVQPASPDGPSIVVLPFQNLSRDPDQQYFADGVTEDLTTDLSRIPGLLVISRSTAFTYMDKPVDVRQIGRELRVRYVLEGSVRRSSHHVRVNAQLIDAGTGGHLWAERFDRPIGEVFALQDEITGRISAALNLRLIIAESERPSARPDALDFMFRGRAAFAKRASRETYAEAVDQFQRALELVPQSAEARSWLAIALTGRVLDFMSDTIQADMILARRLVEESLNEGAGHPLVHFANGTLLLAEHRCSEAVSEYQAVLALNPNSAITMANLARCRIYVGPLEQAIPLLERAIDLSPRDPQIPVWYFRMGEAHLLQSHLDDAIGWLDKARRANPGYWYIHAYLAAACGLAGHLERAATELAEARRLNEHRWPVTIALSRERTAKNFTVAETRSLVEATFLVGLRAVGVPEE
jgi:TolB-like protein/Tfp pilus assembly protein PilF